MGSLALLIRAAGEIQFGGIAFQRHIQQHGLSVALSSLTLPEAASCTGKTGVELTVSDHYSLLPSPGPGPCVHSHRYDQKVGH
jgi:hypothetical protein